MHLTYVGIRNFRSLEKIELVGVSRTNVLIGRNNSGKSSIFGALQYLSKVLSGEGTSIPWERILTNRDSQRSLEINLHFDTTKEERGELITLLKDFGYPTEKIQSLENSPFGRKIKCTFRSSKGSPENLHLRETLILSADSEAKFATIQKLIGDDNVVNPQSFITYLEDLVKISEPLASELDVETSRFKTQIQIHRNQKIQVGRPLTEWPYNKIRDYFQNAFFFDPFRHSLDMQAVSEVGRLAQDGSNLPQTLHTLLSNNRPKLEQIDQFMKDTLPDIGILQTPLSGTNTGVNFRVPYGGFNVRIYDMGGGIEQLLMVATVLLTTDDNNTIFLEEPESHLHAGAQRFLLERLTKGKRQVFITTHSPVFINTSPEKSMYEVSYSKGQSHIKKIQDANGLEMILNDIGAKNSDVLLSNAIVFVEGNGDKNTLIEISKKLGLNFEEQNITILPMGGGSFRGLPIRSEVLENISQKSPVPHMFILDRDERSTGQILRLKKSLGKGKVTILRSRELENYLILPIPLLNALRIKAQNNQEILERLEKDNVAKIQSLIATVTNDLYGLVLLKRIKNRIGGLPEGFISKDIVSSLMSKVTSKNLTKYVEREIRTRLTTYIRGINIKKVIEEEKKLLDTLWKDPKKRLVITPGEEIIGGIYRYFGCTYEKPKDTVLIAKFLNENDINPEIKKILIQAISLAK